MRKTLNLTIFSGAALSLMVFAGPVQADPDVAIAESLDIFSKDMRRIAEQVREASKSGEGSDAEAGDLAETLEGLGYSEGA